MKTRVWMTAAWLMLAHSVSWAATSGESAPSRPAPFDSANLVQWMGGLVLVLALIVAAAWLARRFGHFHTASAGQLRILGGLSVGTREKIILLKAGPRHLLLGVAPNQVQTLHVFERDEIDEATPAGQADFADSLRSVMRRGRQT